MRLLLARRASALAWLASLASLLVLAALPVRPLRAQGTTPTDRRPRVAVVYFDNFSPLDPGKYDPLAKGITDRLILELAQGGTVRVFERERLQKLLDEITRGRQPGLMDPTTAAQAGRIVGATHIIRGAFIANPRGRRMEIVALVENPETSEVTGSVKVAGKPDDILDLIADVGRQLNEKMRGVEPQPRSPVPSRSGSFEATMLHSRAMVEEDRGNAQQAAVLMQELRTRFPGYLEERTRLAVHRGPG